MLVVLNLIYVQADLVNYTMIFGMKKEKHTAHLNFTEVQNNPLKDSPINNYPQGWGSMDMVRLKERDIAKLLHGR